MADDLEELHKQIDALAVEVEQLTAALASRDLLWTAKLELARRHNLDAAQAHHVLMDMSNTSNRKAVDVAAEIVQRAAS